MMSPRMSQEATSLHVADSSLSLCEADDENDGEPSLLSRCTENKISAAESGQNVSPQFIDEGACSKRRRLKLRAQRQKHHAIGIKNQLHVPEYAFTNKSVDDVNTFERFSGKIVYNLDGSTYIIDKDMSDEDCEKIPLLRNVESAEGSITVNCGEDQISSVGCFPPIAHAIYVMRNAYQEVALNYAKLLAEERNEDKTLTPIVHSYRVFSAKKFSKNMCLSAEKCLGIQHEISSDKDHGFSSSMASLLSAYPPQVPIKPILMCFICSFSFGCAKSFINHCISDHQLNFNDNEKTLLNDAKNISAIIQSFGEDKQTLVSFLEPVTDIKTHINVPNSVLKNSLSSSSFSKSISTSFSSTKLPSPMSVTPPPLPTPTVGLHSSGLSSPILCTATSVLSPRDANTPSSLTTSPASVNANEAAIALLLQQQKMILQSPPPPDILTPRKSPGDSSPLTMTSSATPPQPLQNSSSNNTNIFETKNSADSPITINSAATPSLAGHSTPVLQPGFYNHPLFQNMPPNLLMSPTPISSAHIPSSPIGICPDHLSGKPVGIECSKCDLIFNASCLPANMQGSTAAGWNMSRNSCKTLKCPKCNWHYKYQETLEIHMKEKHPDTEPTCIYCATGQQHPRLARGETYTCGYKPYRCEVCNYSTTTKGNLSIHMQSDKHLNNMQEIQNGGVVAPSSSATSPESSVAMPSLRTLGGTSKSVSTRSLSPGLISSHNAAAVMSNKQQKLGSKPSWRCDVCNYETDVVRNLRIHMTSEKHMHNVIVQQQNVKNIQKHMSSALLQQMMAAASSISSAPSLSPTAAPNPSVSPVLAGFPSGMLKHQQILQLQQSLSMLNAAAGSLSSGNNLQTLPLFSSTGLIPPPVSSLSGTASGQSLLSQQQDTAASDMAFNQALFTQLMHAAASNTQNQLSNSKLGSDTNCVSPAPDLASISSMLQMQQPLDIPSLLLSHQPTSVSLPTAPSSDMTPSCNMDINPDHIFTCCVCREFSCDSFDTLSSHLLEDRSKIRENEVSVVLPGGTYLCQLCNYKTNLKANFQLHCKTDKHLQRLGHVNHIKEGGFANEWKLRFLSTANPTEIRCNTCDFFTNSMHKLQVHVGSHPHQISTILFEHLQKMENDMKNISQSSKVALKYECTLCKFVAEGKNLLMTHVRSMKHLQMEQLHQLQKRAEGQQGQTDIGEIFKIVEDHDDDDMIESTSGSKEIDYDQRHRIISGNFEALSNELLMAGDGKTPKKDELVVKSENLMLQHSTPIVTCPLCRDEFSSVSDMEKHALAVHCVNSDGVQRLQSLMNGSHWLNLIPGNCDANQLQETNIANRKRGLMEIESHGGLKRIKEEPSGKLYKGESGEARVIIEEQMLEKHPTERNKPSLSPISNSSIATTEIKPSNTRPSSEGYGINYSLEKYLDPNRPYKCCVCKESFTQKNILLVHYNSVSHLHRLKKSLLQQEHQKDGASSVLSEMSDTDVATAAKQILLHTPVFPSTPVSKGSALETLVGNMLKGSNEAAANANPTVNDSEDEKLYKCNICKVAYNQGSTLDIHVRSVLHNSRAAKLQELILTGQIDVSRPLIEQPSCPPDCSITNSALSECDTSNIDATKTNPLTENNILKCIAKGLVPNLAQSSASPIHFSQSISQMSNSTITSLLTTSSSSSVSTKASSPVLRNLLQNYGFDLVKQFNENYQLQKDEIKNESDLNKSEVLSEDVNKIKTSGTDIESGNVANQAISNEVVQLLENAKIRLKPQVKLNTDVNQKNYQDKYIPLLKPTPTVEGNNLLECPICAKEFYSIYDLKIHSEENHNFVMPPSVIQKFLSQPTSDEQLKLSDNSIIDLEGDTKGKDRTTPSKTSIIEAKTGSKEELECCSGVSTFSRPDSQVSANINDALSVAQTPPPPMMQPPNFGEMQNFLHQAMNLNPMIMQMAQLHGLHPFAAMNLHPPLITPKLLQVSSSSSSVNTSNSGGIPSPSELQALFMSQYTHTNSINPMNSPNCPPLDPKLLSLMAAAAASGTGTSHDMVSGQVLDPIKALFQSSVDPKQLLQLSQINAPEQPSNFDFMKMSNPRYMSSKDTNTLIPDSQGLTAPISVSGAKVPVNNLLPEQKRARTRISDDQLKILRSNFDINNSPSETTLNEMAQQTGLPLKVIKHWFRNTLFKERQKNKDSPYNFNNPPSSTLLNLEEYAKTDDSKPTAASLNEYDTNNLNFKMQEVGDIKKECPDDDATKLEEESKSFLGEVSSLKMEQKRNQARDSQILLETVTKLSTLSPVSMSSPLHSSSSTPIDNIENKVPIIFPKIEDYSDSNNINNITSLSNQLGGVLSPESVNTCVLGSNSSSLLPTFPVFPSLANSPLPNNTGGIPDYLNNLAQKITSVETRPLSPQMLYSGGDLALYSNGGGIPNGGKRANRTRFSDYQIKVLQEFFENNAYPKDDDLEYLSKLLGLSPRVIVVWFQNARQKARKVYENQPPAGSASVSIGNSGDNSGEFSLNAAAEGDEPGRFIRTPGLNYQCKKCLLVFQRYYELIRHQKQHCFKEEDAKKSAMAQKAAAQAAAQFAIIGGGSGPLSSPSSTMAPYSEDSNSSCRSLCSPPGLGISHGTSVFSSSMFSSDSKGDHELVEDRQTSDADEIARPPINREILSQLYYKQLASPTQSIVSGKGGNVGVNNSFNFSQTSPFGLLQQQATHFQQQHKNVGLQFNPNILDTNESDDYLDSESVVSSPSSIVKRKLSEDGDICDDSSDNGSMNDKRLRTNILPDQIAFLYHMYKNDCNPDRKLLDKIAAEVGLKKRVVQVWFQNARAREPKGQLRGLSRTPLSSSSDNDVDVNNQPQDEVLETDQHDTVVSRSNVNTSTSISSSMLPTMTNLPPRSYEAAPFGISDRIASIISSNPSSIDAAYSNLQSTMRQYYEDTMKHFIKDMGPSEDIIKGSINKDDIDQNYCHSPLPANMLQQNVQAIDLTSNVTSYQNTSSADEGGGLDGSLGDEHVSGIGGIGGSGSNKRFRTQMSGLQVKLMKSIFEVYKTPTMSECSNLGRDIGLQKRVVQVWFQNARAKEKRAKLQLQAVTGHEPDPFPFPEECKVCSFKYDHKFVIQDHLFSKSHLDAMREALKRGQYSPESPGHALAQTAASLQVAVNSDDLQASPLSLVSLTHMSDLKSSKTSLKVTDKSPTTSLTISDGDSSDQQRKLIKFVDGTSAVSSSNSSSNSHQGVLMQV